MSIVRILAIETSCDDTSVAIVEAEQKRGEKTPRFKVLQSIVSSQTDIHRHWGGVVPTLAKREHEKNLPLIWRRMSDDRSPSSVTRPPSLVNLVAVTVGPGLEPALWAGIEFAKKLSKELKIPLVGANHLEGHLYSNLLPLDGRRPKTDRSSVIRHPSFHAPTFPAIVLLVSGGHTMLVHMKSLRSWKVLGRRGTTRWARHLIKWRV